VSTGDDVVAFQSLGEVGHSGPCTDPIAHIHLGVLRIRNVNDALMDVPPLIPHGGLTTERRVVDPFGWNNSSIFDPWGFWAPAGFGAVSINLWKSTSTPPDWPSH
jgi:hypothetical protein